MREPIFNLYIAWDDDKRQYGAIVDDCESRDYSCVYASSKLECVLEATRVLTDIAIQKHVSELWDEWENER